MVVAGLERLGRTRSEADYACCQRRQAVRRQLRVYFESPRFADFLVEWPFVPGKKDFKKRKGGEDTDSVGIEKKGTTLL